MSPCEKTVDRTLSGALATLVSRLLGFVRDSLIAYFLGAGADAFLAAFRIPNVMRRLVAEGALGMAHTAEVSLAPPDPSDPSDPVFSDAPLDPAGPKDPAPPTEAPACTPFDDVVFSLLTARRFMAAAALIFLALFCLAPLVIRLVAPGLSAELLAPAAGYLRICALYLPPAAASAVLAALLVARGEAGRAALSPAFLNMTIIGAVCVASLGHMGQPALSTALALGVAAGGLAQLYWLVWHVKNLAPHLPLRQCWRLLMPGKRPRTMGSTAPATPPRSAGGLGRLICTVVGASGIQLHLLAGMAAASLLPQGAITALYFAERLVEFPLALVGGAVLFAVLPGLARSAALQCREKLREKLADSLRLVLFLALPAAVGLFALSESIVQALFTHGAFGEEEKGLASLALRCLAPGLPAMCLVKPLTGALAALDAEPRSIHRPAYTAPAKAMALAALAGTGAVAAGFVLLNPLLHPLVQGPGPLFPGVAAVALSTSLGAWVQTLFLCWYLRGRHLVSVPSFRSPLFLPVARWSLAALCLGALVAMLPLPGGRMWLALSLCGVLILSVALWFGGFYLAGNKEAVLVCQSLFGRNKGGEH